MLGATSGLALSAAQGENLARGILGGAVGAISAEVMTEGVMDHFMTTPNLSYEDAVHYSSAISKVGGALTAFGLHQDVSAAIYAGCNAVDYNFMSTARRNLDPEAYDLEEEEDEALMQDSGVGRLRAGYTSFFKTVGEKLYLDKFARWLNSDSHYDHRPPTLIQDIERYENLIGPSITVQQKEMIYDLMIDRHLDSGSSNFLDLSGKGKVRAAFSATGMIFESLVAVPSVTIAAGLQLYGASQGTIRATDRVLEDLSGFTPLGGPLKNLVAKGTQYIGKAGARVGSKLRARVKLMTNPERHIIQNSVAQPVKLFDIRGSNQTMKQLLPGEGRVDTYGELIRTNKADYKNLAAHHMPNDNYMGTKNVRKSDGIAINTEHPFPGSGGRHREIHRGMIRQDPDLAPRDALAQSINRARTVYQQDGVYTSQIRESLQEVIQLNKEKFPHLFKE